MKIFSLIPLLLVSSAVFGLSNIVEIDCRRIDQPTHFYTGTAFMVGTLVTSSGVLIDGWITAAHVQEGTSSCRLVMDGAPEVFGLIKIPDRDIIEVFTRHIDGILPLGIFAGLPSNGAEMHTEAFFHGSRHLLYGQAINVTPETNEFDTTFKVGHGASGSPVMDDRGRVRGVITRVYTGSGRAIVEGF